MEQELLNIISIIQCLTLSLLLNLFLLPTYAEYEDARLGFVRAIDNRYL